MNRIKSKIKFLFLITVVIIFYQKSQAQQLYIYQDSVLMQLTGYKSKFELLDSVKKAYIYEIQDLQFEQQKKYQELLKPYNLTPNQDRDQIIALLNDADKEKFNLLIEEDKLLESRIKTYEKLLQQQYERDIQPYLSILNQTLKNYAIKNKVDFIWRMDKIEPHLAYFNGGKNISDIIVNIVNKSLLTSK